MGGEVGPFPDVLDFRVVEEDGGGEAAFSFLQVFPGEFASVREKKTEQHEENAAKEECKQRVQDFLFVEVYVRHQKGDRDDPEQHEDDEQPFLYEPYTPFTLLAWLVTGLGGGQSPGAFFLLKPNKSRAAQF